jgi:hypothetical protein
MHVTYGFVYYFTIFMLLMTVSLSIFALRGLRKRFFNYMKKIRLMDHFVFQSLVYISFIVIFVILIDSVWTYYSLRKNLATGKNLNN